MGDTILGIVGILVGLVMVGTGITLSIVNGINGLLVCVGLAGLVIAHQGADLAFLNPFGWRK